MAQQITEEYVKKAYGALSSSLMSGDLTAVREYWAEDMKWLVPGHNQVSGWKNNLSEFLNFMRVVGELSGNSFNMEWITCTVNAEYSTDVTHNTGFRANDKTKKLDIEVGHTLRWRDGKVIEGKGGIFGDGTAQYDWFWS